MFLTRRSLPSAAMLIVLLAATTSASTRPPRTRPATPPAPERAEIEASDGGYIIVTAPRAAVRAARAAAVPVGANVRMDRALAESSRQPSRSVKP